MFDILEHIWPPEARPQCLKYRMYSPVSITIMHLIQKITSLLWIKNSMLFCPFSVVLIELPVYDLVPLRFLDKALTLFHSIKVGHIPC
jgi:hypothetical protein